jgi:hypothetical protein
VGGFTTPQNAKSKRVFFYRGYALYLRWKDQRIRCVYTMKHCNIWLPREFFWESNSVEDCSQYIDLLCLKKLIEAKKFDDAKLATEHVYASERLEKSNYVNISPVRLMALLRGEEILDIPITSRIRFVVSNKRYTVNDIDAEIFGKDLTDAYFNALTNAVQNGRPVAVVSNLTEKNTARKYGLNLVDHRSTSGCNISLNAELAPESQEVSYSPSPVEETLVKSEEHSTHTETVSLITGQNARPYFVKRLMRGQHLLWCGTSYTATGPWTEYQRDDSRLTALKITIS